LVGLALPSAGVLPDTVPEVHVSEVENERERLGLWSREDTASYTSTSVALSDDLPSEVESDVSTVDALVDDFSVAGLDTTQPIGEDQLEPYTAEPPGIGGPNASPPDLPAPESAVTAAYRSRASRWATFILIGGFLAVTAGVAGLIAWFLSDDSGVEVRSAGQLPASSRVAEPTEKGTPAPTPRDLATVAAERQTAREQPDAQALETRPSVAPSAETEVVLPTVPRSIARMSATRRGALGEKLERKAHRLIRRGRYERAEEIYRRALVYDPESSDVAYGVALALVRRNETVEALAWARRAARLDPSNPDPLVVLGDALRQSGDLSGARQAWERVLSVDSGNRDARRRLRRYR
jgi:Flp pilus assembly protein TadD